MSSPQTAGGRFVSAYRDHELLDVVASAASAGEGRLSQPAFDRIRDRLGHPDCPAARQICRRLNMSWDEVLDHVADPDPHRRVLGQRRSRAQRGFSPAECAAAARGVALRWGRSVAPFDYEIEVARILAVDRRRHLHGRRLRMPRAGQIERALKQPFGEVMKTAAAGLPDKQRAIHASVALNVCIDAHNAVPNEAQLAEFCQANDLALAHDPVTFAQMLVGLNASRALVGSPPVPPLVDQAVGVDFSVRLPGLMERIEHKPLGDLAGAISALAACLDWLGKQPDRPELTEMLYQRFASTHPQWPWYATIQRHGGINALRGRAVEWRAERDRRIREGGSLPTTAEQQAQADYRRQAQQREWEHKRQVREVEEQQRRVESAFRLAERDRQRQAEKEKQVAEVAARRAAVQQKAWNAYLDRQGAAPFDRPPVDLPVLLGDLLCRLEPSLAATLVVLEEHGPQTVAQLEDRLARNRNGMSRPLAMLTDLGAVKPVGQIPPQRGRGPSTTLHGLAVDVPDAVIARARDYQPTDREPAGWTDQLHETYRACLGLRLFGAAALAKTMGFSTHVANQRLTRLVELGAIKRISVDPSRNDAYAYQAVANYPT